MFDLISTKLEYHKKKCIRVQPVGPVGGEVPTSRVFPRRPRGCPVASLGQADLQIFAFGKAPLDLRPLGEELKAKLAFRAKRYAMSKGPFWAFLASPSAKSKGSTFRSALGPAACLPRKRTDGRTASLQPKGAPFPLRGKRLRGKGCRR